MVPFASTVERPTRPLVASSSAPIPTCSPSLSGTKSVVPGRRTKTSPATGSTSTLFWNTGGGTCCAPVVVVVGFCFGGSLGVVVGGSDEGGLPAGGWDAWTTVTPAEDPDLSMVNGAATVPDAFAL